MTVQLPAAVVAAGTWSVSDSRTRVTFAVGSLGRTVHGSLACRWGELEVDEAGTPRRVSAELDLDSIDTGVARRDADLRKPGLLDIDRHPTMTWSADRITQGDDGRWSADGVLHVRGTSTPLTVTGSAEPTADGWLHVRAAAVLDRTAVGIRAPRLLIGRTVAIDLDAWLSCRRPG